VVSRTCRRKKREWSRGRVANLELLAREKSSKGFFREAKNLQRGFQPRCYSIRNSDGELHMSLSSVLGTWADYFEKLLNVDDPIPVEKELIYHTAEVYVEKPTKDEFLLAIHKLKSNKAPGIDGITVEMILHGGDELHER